MLDSTAIGAVPDPPNLGAPRVAAARDSAPFNVRFGWGELGARALVPGSDVVVVVDVITFTTAVAVAVERDCAIYPHPWDQEAAAKLAGKVGAELAVGRSQVGPETPYSLSPVTLSRAPHGTSIVLPSPNGSAVAAAASESGAQVVAGSLRNAFAVARFARRHGGVISVIAAGERWPDRSLDPALEDLVGAGAIIDGLRRRRRSPEAQAAAAVYLQARRHGLRRTLQESVSGREQIERGYAGELDWAAALNVSSAVPVLRAGAFRREPR
ncbi:MAG TPA: 2-phosphosulfolactate phosphatase [Candidatus Nanopelagicaceae bacterium]|nr:2-phosphosulfolactate phosphatase [Candidatus Nanopelagicaceae bacterium]